MNKENRIAQAFTGRKAFIGYLTAGDPSLAKTEEYILEMIKGGANLIEIGIPFSDPVAEGPVIQAASVRALAHGCTTDEVFAMTKDLRTKTEVPLVYMTYLNVLFKYGYERFCSGCREAGVDGLIIPDLPYEEKGELVPIAQKYGLQVIAMIAPTSRERIRMIAAEAEGFIYLVSSMGVTGMRQEIRTDLQDIVAEIRSVTETPVAVGFGIHTREQVEQFDAIADGAIVGSGVVQLVAEHGENAGEAIRSYVAELVS